MSIATRFSLNAFQLKVLALVIMTIDHIYYFFSTFTDMPLLLTLIGRLSAPIFVFMVANGFAHTKSRGKYLLRLYLAATLMQLGNFAMNKLFPLPGGAIIMNGIFSTMTLIVFLLLCIETARSGIHERHVGKALLGTIGVVLPFALNMVVFSVMMTHPDVLRVAMLFLPLPFLVEGSIPFVLMGVGLYYCRNHRPALTIFYCVLLGGLLLLSGVTAISLAVVFFMLLALPLMLLYNGERGRGMKYLFYAYYPAHVYVLAAVVSLLGR